MKTYKFLIWHVDRDYGLDGWYYIDDNKIFSHGYAPKLHTAVLRWLKNIPSSLRLRSLAINLEKLSKEQEEKNA